MPNLEDMLSDMFGGQKKPQPKPMWPEPDLLSQQPQDSGSGPLGIIGKIAQLGASVASLVPGPHQPFMIPVAVGGAAMSGADKGGISGAVKGATVEGVKQAGTAGLGSLAGKAADAIKAPVDTGPMSAFSSTGNALTIPGVRSEPITAYSSQGNPFTVPASPNTVGGS